MKEYCLFFLFFLAFARNYAVPVDFSKCGAVCMIWCPYGNVLNENGCPMCLCNKEPVIMPNIDTVTAHPTTKKACPPVLCRMYCQFGFQTNPDTGCQFCSCNDPPIN